MIKSLKIICLGIGACFATASCALAPVETDPIKRQERWNAMRQDCYARGGVWNEEGHACLNANRNY